MAPSAPPTRGDGASPSSALQSSALSAVPPAAPEEVQRRILLIPLPLRSALLPFQKAGVEAMLKLRGRALLGDEPGLGKTVQAIAAMCAFREEWPVLIVVPSSMRWPWVDELEKWVVATGVCRSGAINVVRDGHNDRIAAAESLITVTTYPLLCAENIAKQVHESRFRVVVADESHNIKNEAAKRTKALLPVLENASRVLLLSGTPALNRPAELWCQLHALRPNAFGRTVHTWYGKHFCNATRKPWGWDLSGGSNLDELHHILRSAFLVRRLKANVLEELPPKTRQRVAVETPPNLDVANGREGKVSELCAKCAKNDSGARKDLLAALTELYASGGAAKVAATAALVNDLLEGGAPKLLVFAHHREVMDSLEGALRAMRVVSGFIRIDGTTPSRERFDLCKRFQTDASCRVALLSVTAAGQGLTLTAAHDVVFAELHWVPAVLMQAEDRVHRIGQKAGGVCVRYVCLKNSLDDFMWRTLERKLRTIAAAVDGGDGGVLEKEDVDCEGGERVLEVDGDGDGGGLVSRFLSWHRKAYGGGGGARQSGGVAVKVHFDKEDIRSFFRKPEAKQPAVVIEDCEKCPKGVEADGGDADESGSQRKPVVIDGESDGDGDDGEGTQERPVVLEGDPPDEAPASPGIPRYHGPPRSYAFDVSLSTGRCFVAAFAHDAREKAAIGTRTTLWMGGTVLGSFAIEEVAAGGGGGSGVLDDDARAACQRFARSWLMLSPQARAAVAGSGILLGPGMRLGALAAQIQSAARPSMASAGPSTTRVITMETYVARAADGTCATCGAAMGTAGVASPFCSEACRKQARLMTDASVARKQLFELERGVCQRCGLNAHELHGRLAALGAAHARERLLRDSGFPADRATALARAAAIAEGDLWQADHIVPVSEGGGECTLENLRTLCTPCHAAATRELAARASKRRRFRDSRAHAPETILRFM